MSGSKQRALALALGMSGGMMLSGHAMAVGAWYVGVGGGVSMLSPDTTGSPFTLDEEQSQTGTAFAGLDINDWLSAEVAYTDLGFAGLSSEQEIGYTAISVGGIAYVLGNRGMDERQSGLSGYVRLGLNSITNESQILLNEADNTAVWVGAGIQYPLGARFGLRAELASYDGDAQAAVASIYWRSKDDGGRRGGLISGGQRSTPSVVVPDEQTRNGGYKPVEEFDEYKTERDVAVNTRGPEIIDPRGSGINNNYNLAPSAECNAPSVGEPKDATGCALFTGTVEGVEFQVGGSQLTPDSEYILDSLALSLNNHPRLVIELQVHTEAFSERGRDMQISRERVRTVARYLAGQGVDVKRLRARAFGATQPRFANSSPESRRLNNRVALRVL